MTYDLWPVTLSPLQVELIKRPSDEVIPRLREDFGIERLDFVFMDHWKRCYLPDLQALEDSGLLGEGSVVLADNVLFPGAPSFLRHVRRSGLYEHRVHRAALEYIRGIRDGMAELVYRGIKWRIPEGQSAYSIQKTLSVIY